jgi:tRNA U54 and U55 pseudouridine synthase Pus10
MNINLKSLMKKKKFENVKKRKEKTYKTYNIFVSFFKKLEKEKVNEKFYVKTTNELF